MTSPAFLVEQGEPPRNALPSQVVGSDHMNRGRCATYSSLGARPRDDERGRQGPSRESTVKNRLSPRPSSDRGWAPVPATDKHTTLAPRARYRGVRSGRRGQRERACSTRAVLPRSPRLRADWTRLLRVFRVVHPCGRGSYARPTRALALGFAHRADTACPGTRAPSSARAAASPPRRSWVRPERAGCTRTSGVDLTNAAANGASEERRGRPTKASSCSQGSPLGCLEEPITTSRLS